VRLAITVVDGDTNERVRDAAVTAWGRRDRTDDRGRARIRVPWRRPLTVSVAARGYESRAVRESFRRSRYVTVRIYRPELQWTLYGATPTRTGAHPGIDLRPPFKVVWSRGLGSLIEFPAVVKDSVAYIGNSRATVSALSMRSGRVIWQRRTPGGEMASSPTVVGGSLVYHDMRGHVNVVDRESGKLLRETAFGSPIESSPIVSNGVDYFGTWDGRIVALDLRRGRVRWVKNVGAKITSSVAIAGRTLYVGDYAGRLWALAPSTGRTRWVGTVNGRIYGTPAVSRGRVFVPSSSGGSLTAFTTRGRRLWSFHPGAYVYSSPAVWNGRVFFGSYNGVFYCLSAATGRVQWTVGTGGPVSGAAVVVAGVAYAGSFAHKIVGVDARSGRVLIRFPHGDYVPVSGNGARLLFHGFSRLYAVEPLRDARPRRRVASSR
jgi:outer membrane protein assembly factor BamB